MREDTVHIIVKCVSQLLESVLIKHPTAPLFIKLFCVKHLVLCSLGSKLLPTAGTIRPKNTRLTRWIKDFTYYYSMTLFDRRWRPLIIKFAFLQFKFCLESKFFHLFMLTGHLYKLTYSFSQNTIFKSESVKNEHTSNQFLSYR